MAPPQSHFFAALLPIFNQDYLGLSARWIGIASIIYTLWNAFYDPVFGNADWCAEPDVLSTAGRLIDLVKEKILAMHAEKEAQFKAIEE